MYMYCMWYMYCTVQKYKIHVCKDVLLIYLYGTLVSPRWRTVQCSIYESHWSQKLFRPTIVVERSPLYIYQATLWHTHEVFDCVSVRCLPLLR